MHAHTASCSCGGPARRAWPDNLRRVQVTVAGVPDMVRGLIARLDAVHSDGLAGRSGVIRAGDGADPAYGFRGYVAYRRTAALEGAASDTLRRGPWTALPATSGDVNYLTAPGASVMDHLRGLTPGGAR